MVVRCINEVLDGSDHEGRLRWGHGSFPNHEPAIVRLYLTREELAMDVDRSIIADKSLLSWVVSLLSVVHQSSSGWTTDQR